MRVRSVADVFCSRCLWEDVGVCLFAAVVVPLWKRCGDRDNDNELKDTIGAHRRERSTRSSLPILRWGAGALPVDVDVDVDVEMEMNQVFRW